MGDKNRPLQIKKCTYKEYVLIFVGVLSFVVAMYAILTYGQTYIHADSSLPLRFFNAIKESGSLYPKSWNAANGEVYTFDTMPFSLLTMAVMHNMVLARVIATALSYGVACAGLVWLSKKVFKNEAWTIILPLFCVYMASANTRDMLLWQAAYCPEVVAITWGAGLFYLLVAKEQNVIHTKVVLIAHSILLLLMMTRGIRYIAEYILPLLLTIMVYQIVVEKHYSVKSIWQDCKKALSCLGIPSLLGFTIYELLSHSSNMNYNETGSIRFVTSIGAIARNIRVSFVDVAKVFGYSSSRPVVLNIVIWGVALSVFVVFPLMQCMDYKKLSEAERAFLIFGLSHNLVLLSVIILCSKAGGHYILSSIFVALIISGCFIYRKIQSTNKYLSVAITLTFIVITLVYSIDLYKLTIGWQDKVDNQRAVAQRLVDEGVSKVFATYWVGYPYGVYSDNKLTVGAVDATERSFKAYYWLVDSNVYKKKDGKSCVLLTEQEDDQLYETGDENPIATRVGKEYNRMVLEDAYIYDYYNGDVYTHKNLVAYIFDEDISDKITNGLKDGILQPREMFFNYLGNWSEEGITLTLGGIVHGPYLPINAGNYRVKIIGSNLNVCGCAVVSEQAQQNIEWHLVSEDDECKELEMTIFNKVDDIQFYLNNPTEETALFYNVTIQKMD